MEDGARKNIRSHKGNDQTLRTQSSKFQAVGHLCESFLVPVKKQTFLWVEPARYHGLPKPSSCSHHKSMFIVGFVVGFCESKATPAFDHSADFAIRLEAIAIHFKKD